MEAVCSNAIDTPAQTLEPSKSSWDPIRPLAPQADSLSPTCSACREPSPVRISTGSATPAEKCVRYGVPARATAQMACATAKQATPASTAARARALLDSTSRFPAQGVWPAVLLDSTPTFTTGRAWPATRLAQHALLQASTAALHVPTPSRSSTTGPVLLPVPTAIMRTDPASARAATPPAPRVLELPAQTVTAAPMPTTIWTTARAALLASSTSTRTQTPNSASHPAPTQRCPMPARTPATSVQSTVTRTPPPRPLVSLLLTAPAENTATPPPGSANPATQSARPAPGPPPTSALPATPESSCKALLVALPAPPEPIPTQETHSAPLATATA